MRSLVLGLLLAGSMAADGSAAVQLAIRDGRVWLAADRATVAQILSEWARVGRTQILNGDRLPEGPLSLVLEGLPEQQALEIVLRSAGGYVAVNRAAWIGDPAASRFERIVIVPASAAPSPPPLRAADVLPHPQAADPIPLVTSYGAQRVIGPDGQPVPDDQEDAPPRPPTGSMPPGFSPQPEEPPQPPRLAAPTPTPTAPGGVARPGMVAPVTAPKRPGGSE